MWLLELVHFLQQLDCCISKARAALAMEDEAKQEQHDVEKRPYAGIGSRFT